MANLINYGEALTKLRVQQEQIISILVTLMEKHYLYLWMGKSWSSIILMELSLKLTL